MEVGIARFTGLATQAADAAEDAEIVGGFSSAGLLLTATGGFSDLGAPLLRDDGGAAGRFTGVFSLFVVASRSSSGIFGLFFFSTRAMASASHAAFNLPRAAGRSLFHSRERPSPAISSMLRLLSTDSSISPASYPSTTWSSCFLIISHSLPLLPGRRPFILIRAKSPLRRFPFKRNFRSPLAIMAAASASVPGKYFPSTGTGERGCQVPTSHTMTLPAP